MNKFIVALLGLVVATEAIQLEAKNKAKSHGEGCSKLRSQKKYSLVATEGEEEEKFVEWIMSTGKLYKNSAELKAKKDAWKANNKLIAETNAKADASGDSSAVKLDHNIFSDMTLA